VVVATEMMYDPLRYLGYGDVQVSNHQNLQVLEVYIKASKMDPYRKGVCIYLGGASLDLCSVAALLELVSPNGRS